MIIRCNSKHWDYIARNISKRQCVKVVLREFRLYFPVEVLHFIKTQNSITIQVHNTKDFKMSSCNFYKCLVNYEFNSLPEPILNRGLMFFVFFGKQKSNEIFKANGFSLRRLERSFCFGWHFWSIAHDGSGEHSVDDNVGNCSIAMLLHVLSVYYQVVICVQFL